MSEYYQGYKIRIYPNKVQEEIIWNHINGCRFWWNHLLELNINRYKNGEERLREFDMNNLISNARLTFEWLENVCYDSLSAVSRMLNNAYERFFNKTAGHPKFHSKKYGDLTYPVRDNRFYIIDDTYMQIPGLGRVKYRPGNYNIPFETRTRQLCKKCNVRIHYSQRNNKWTIGFTVKRENQALPLNDYTMGIDLGLNKLATVKTEKSTFIIKNVNKSKRMKNAVKRRKRDQRRTARKQRNMYEHINSIGKTVYEPSKNWIKSMNKVRKDYAHEANIRNDYIHKYTTKLANMYPSQIVMETIKVSHLIRNRNIADTILNACWFKFTNILRYKSERRGIDFRQVPRNYPSSKTCSNCGTLHSKLRMTKDRLFVCPNCGYTVDRDINAATNLMNYFK